jgi:hypothetical protein
VIDWLPERARVRQVTVGGVGAFWTDGAATGWNVGGDRLWLGPEWAWYWTDLGTYDVATHRVQPSVDPGEWVVDGLTARHEVTLRHLHRGGDVRARVARSFEPLGENAYRATASVELLDPPDDAAVSLWSLVQVPLGGEVLVPAPAGTEPRGYFDPAPPGSWRHDGTALRIRLGGDALFKLGVAPVAGVDRYAYARPLGDGRHVVVARRFAVEPGAAYADVPLHALGSQGDAVEVFCDGGRLGEFGEVEHHSPAATAARPRVIDESVLTVSLVDDLDGWYDAWLADAGDAAYS